MITPAVDRLRAAVACLVLTAVVFVDEAGRVVGDTKLDLTVDVGSLLARSLHLWDPSAGAGQLQNQGYGYLFPLGPLFALLQAAGLPDWAVQRTWQAVVLCTALLGARALAARLDLGSPTTRLLAGVVYALAPRPLSQVGAISVEVWPYALAPWVLVPLVTATRTGSVRRGAALSGLAVLLVGGVNAAATLAVVPLGVLWLALAPPGPRRRRLAAWWALSVGLACAWWLGPLLLLGRYSPPFLDVIESAATTTGQTGLWSVLTGNDLWLQYLALGEPARPAGFLLVSQGPVVLCVTALAALGLVGLLHRATPHRGFLVGGVLLGLLVVGAGHVGPLGRPFAGLERDLLDGALAAFRNVHKYDLLLRLPLALALAHAAAVLRLPRSPVRPVGVLAALALLGTAAPVVGQLQPRDSFVEVPPYWSQVADFLDAADPAPAPTRALVVPAAPFGDYAWGRPGDEPLQPLADSPWVVRDAVPLGGPGVTRVLDTVEEVLRSGRGSPALAAYLARAGVRHLVVRNDLDATASGATRRVVVHASLDASPGLVKVAEFGPPVGAGLGTGPLVVDANLALTYPAVEVYEVAGDVDALTTWPRAGTQRVSGGPESVLPLLEAGLLTPTGATRLAGEDPLPGEASELRTVTDGFREREVDVGRASDGASATLGAGVVRRLDRPVADVLPVPAEGSQTTAVVRGVTSVAASSSAADADATAVRGRDHHPAAAFDGNGSTTWVTGGVDPRGQWVEARFPRTRLDGVDLVLPLVEGVGGRPTRVRLTTDAGDVDVPLPTGSTTVDLDVDTTRLRVTLLELDGLGPGGFGVSAVEAVLRTPAGPLLAERGLRVPDDAAVATGGRPARDPLAVLLTAARRDRPGCVRVGERPVCSPVLPLADEDSDAVDRTLVVDRDALYGVGVAARVRPGPAVHALLQRGQPVVAEASSTAVPDAGARPAAVVDADLDTGWLAAPLDRAPRIALTLARPARLTGLQVVVDQYLAASRPTAVTVLVDGQPVSRAPLRLAPDGRATFAAPVVGRRVEVRVAEVDVRRSLRRDGLVVDLPVGVTELRLLGPPTAAVVQRLDPSAVLAQDCADGPALAVDGELAVATRVRATVAALLTGGAVAVEPCNAPLELPAGEHRLRIARTPTVQVTGLSLVDLARPAPASGPSRVERVVRWDSTSRAVEVAPGAPSWLVVHEAYNAGWQARLDGRPLTAARLDGWQQAFALPRDGGRVELVFAPDRAYRAALAVGAVLALLLVVLVLLPVRRPSPAAGERRRTRPGPLLAAAALPLLGGLAGAGALAVATAVARLRPAALSALGVAPLVLAGGLVALQPWPDRTLLGAPVTALCLLSAAALAASLLPAARRPDPTTAAASPGPRRAAGRPRRRRA